MWQSITSYGDLVHTLLAEDRGGLVIGDAR